LSHGSLIQHYLDTAQPFIDHYGYPAIFLGVLLEDFGLPVPGETLLVAAALLASRGSLDIHWLVLLAWTGAVIGDNIGYAIGRFGGRSLALRYGCYVGLGETHFRRVEDFFDRFGGLVVMFARFFAVLRQLNGIVAGFAGMDWHRFFAYNMIGAALWVGVWGMGVYLFEHRLEWMLTHIKTAEPYIVAAGLAALCWMVYFLLRKRRRRDRPVE